VGGKTKRAFERELPEVLKVALKLSRRHGKKTLVQVCQELDLKTEQVKALRKALSFFMEAPGWRNSLHHRACGAPYASEERCICAGDRKAAFVKAMLAGKKR
jgi:hypothetical protein